MELKEIKEALEKGLEIFKDAQITIHIDQECDSVFFADGFVYPNEEPSPFAGIDKTDVEVERYSWDTMRYEKVYEPGYYTWYIVNSPGSMYEPPTSDDVEICTTIYVHTAITKLILWLAEQQLENKIYRFFPEY